MKTVQKTTVQTVSLRIDLDLNTLGHSVSQQRPLSCVTLLHKTN